VPSFQHFQNQAEQKSGKPKFSNEALNLSLILQYAESAKKQSFQAVCRLQPLVKAYRAKIEEASQAIGRAESSFEKDAEIPESYAAALSLVKESFAVHLASLDEWMSVLAEKTESSSLGAVAKAKQTGEQLATALEGLSVPK
jgi:hypothetical protein